MKYHEWNKDRNHHNYRVPTLVRFLGQDSNCMTVYVAGLPFASGKLPTIELDSDVRIIIQWSQFVMDNNWKINRIGNGLVEYAPCNNGNGTDT